MARKCTVCEHPKRKQIDKALVDPGSSLRNIAKQYTVSIAALSRHVTNGHIQEKIQKSAEAHEKVEADDLLKEIREIESTTKGIIKTALARKVSVKTEEGTKKIDHPDHPTALKAIDTRGKQIELKGKIMGVFREKVEHSGKGGGPIEHAVNLNIAEEVKKVAHLLPDVQQ